MYVSNRIFALMLAALAPVCLVACGPAGDYDATAEAAQLEGSGSDYNADVKETDVAGDFPKPEMDTALAEAPGEARAVFAGGCFWCTEAVFEQIDGVTSVVSGYAGGSAETASYREVASGGTKHAEAIEIVYDPSKVTYGELLRVFMYTHDPTTLNRQGPDRGTQYRSAVFYADDEQKNVTQAYIEQLESANVYNDAIVTTLEPLDQFYEAEDYHQDFVSKNPNHPYVRAWVPTKLKKVEKLQSSQED